MAAHSLTVQAQDADYGGFKSASSVKVTSARASWEQSNVQGCGSGESGMIVNQHSIDYSDGIGLRELMGAAVN